jgi:hypothetical protein
MNPGQLRSSALAVLRQLAPEDAPPISRNGKHTSAPSDAMSRAAPQFDERPVIVRLGDVKSERVSWLTPGFLPLGKFVIIEGDPGQGKSTLSLEIAARITTGESVLGGARHDPRNVVLVTYEDGLADTVRPRIDALGGDADRVIVFRGIAKDEEGTERPPTFPDDIRHLRDLVEEYDAALVIVDPLGAALSVSTDSHNDASTRRVVSQLARLAEDTGACVLGVRHLTKAAASNAVRAGGGSIAFIGQARVALLVSEHPDDGAKPQHERRRVLATVKNNLAPHPASRMFELLQPEGHEHARLRWLGETSLSADDLNAAHAAAAPEERDAATERADWLREVLSAGPVEGKELYTLAREAHYPERTLRHTARAIGVRIRREGIGRSHRTLWELATPATLATLARHENVAGVARVPSVLDVAI